LRQKFLGVSLIAKKHWRLELLLAPLKGVWWKGFWTGCACFFTCGALGIVLAGDGVKQQQAAAAAAV